MVPLTTSLPAGAVLHGRQAAQQAEQDPGQSSPGAVEAKVTGHKGNRLAAQSKSDTSQLANFYQQAAAEEQQAADERQAAGMHLQPGCNVVLLAYGWQHRQSSTLILQGNDLPQALVYFLRV